MQEFLSVKTREASMPNLEAVSPPALRQDVWAINNAQTRAHYQVLAEAEPDLLCRVLNLFAMQYLIPQQVSVLQQDQMLMIEVQLDGLSWHRAQVIGEKIRNLINVCSVTLEPVEAQSVLPQPVALAAC
jgi:acetolactate synthase small subunit